MLLIKSPGVVALLFFCLAVCVVCDTKKAAKMSTAVQFGQSLDLSEFAQNQAAGACYDL